MWRRDPVRNLAFGVILLFILMLGSALYKLLSLQEEISADIGENMVWALSQSVYQSVQLRTAASVRPVTAESEENYALHLDLLKANLNMLTEGPQRRYMERSGVMQALGKLQEDLEEPPIDYNGVVQNLRRIGNDVMVAEREYAGMRRDANHALILQVIGTVLGLLITGALLCWQMLKSLRLEHQAREEVQLQHTQTRRLLEVLQQERSTRLRYRDFVSLMSHQLRTPLAVIDSTAQRLKRQLTEPGQTENLLERSQRIRSSVNHLNHLIGRVLDGLRIEEGLNSTAEPLQIDVQRCDWHEVIQSTLERFGDLFNEREIRLISDGADQPLWVECDRTWCIEILCNLISNAHKYSPATSPIDILIATQDSTFTCSVRDYGAGVPEQDVRLVFERFYRSESTGSVAGIGLGLPIARTLAEWQGGSVELTNASDGGAVFTLMLPWTASAENAFKQ